MLASQSDARSIMGTSGAEKLSKRGDMLLKTKASVQPILVHGVDIPIENINNVTDYLREQEKPQYSDEVISQPVLLR
jgi:S-DNA-T family DNA segregation ATPase FtsK/SpoIIIE